MCGGDAALCQITLTTCLRYKHMLSIYFDQPFFWSYLEWFWDMNR